MPKSLDDFLQELLELHLENVNRDFHKEMDPASLKPYLRQLKNVIAAGEQAKAYVELYKRREEIKSRQTEKGRPEQGPPYRIYAEDLIALYLWRDFRQQEGVDKSIPVDQYAIAGLIPKFKEIVNSEGTKLFNVGNFHLNTNSEGYYSRNIDEYVSYLRSEGFIEERPPVLTLTGAMYLRNIVRTFHQNYPRTAVELARVLDTSIEELIT